MNMSYGYDAVGNILSLGNSAAIPAGTALYGGTTAYTFGYDNLYELTSATGAFTKPNVPVQKFTLAMSYDGIHNITHKTQTAFNLLSNGSKTPNLPLTYDWAYALRRCRRARGQPDRQPPLPVRRRRQPGRLDRHR